MVFRKLAIAAFILTVIIVAGLAAFTLADEARGEASQTTIDRTDELAVEEDVRQKLVSDDDHDPTAYGDSVTVTYDGEEWDEGEDYEYYPEDGEIEFLRDEPDEATVDYQYEIPRDQLTDEQLQTITESYNLIGMVGVGLAFVSLFLFIGGFVASRIKPANTGRGR